MDDPSTGSNLFSGVVQGRAVINETGVELLAQQNDWGSTSVETIKNNLLTGPIEIDPVLQPGTAADTGSLYVTVWNAANQARIAGATVEVSNAGGASVTIPELLNGVYSVPVLRAGEYTISVAASGFADQDIAIALDAGELGSHIVALLAQAEEKPGGPTCYAGAGAAGALGWSDGLLALVLLAALLLLPAGRQSRSTTRG